MGPSTKLCDLKDRAVQTYRFKKKKYIYGKPYDKYYNHRAKSWRVWGKGQM